MNTKDNQPDSVEDYEKFMLDENYPEVIIQEVLSMIAQAKAEERLRAAELVQDTLFRFGADCIRDGRTPSTHEAVNQLSTRIREVLLNQDNV